MNNSEQRSVELGHHSDLTLRLSKRERQIVTLISRGLSNQEIAETLFLSINSIKTYIRSAYRRLDVTSRSQAVIWGIRNEQRLSELEDLDARETREAPARPGPDPMTKRALWMIRPDQP